MDKVSMYLEQGILKKRMNLLKDMLDLNLEEEEQVNKGIQPLSYRI